MQQPSKLQISDLDSNQPDIVQEITPEEAKNIVGGCGCDLPRPVKILDKVPVNSAISKSKK